MIHFLSLVESGSATVEQLHLVARSAHRTSSKDVAQGMGELMTEGKHKQKLMKTNNGERERVARLELLH